ncbi:MAG: elongation factor Ts [Candidatus Blackburnbacteria bacterium RIFCSPHIGHO2_01_FULL_44_64]|uniref:Elongation factor Ts n=1 Tax=Candidatus Blackburnbacteria bacterium RIFCSPHIGHO2_02_FULL_44_20 TaxID=1797516 RepID=A0A1G1V5J7_9BACT|nr:MAG: elongation factor Ts [Candidatus Blackburnbacteria bacterium RIFCSPHIGHO2_01_FULL_44_64]OGY10680.1 MAG: elongation factor Ts [Candidatus Blackburnbacteria bacterium RIFCSPHIGHO2_02_FULL_44_20]OGY11073.1 MAG: elongation factor Ts [Candidatus Blackburnbacteria bacterium RIFCSPHIGHO2_12_FULL_44_25]OGY13457.1 MAG: elongation factor Ts [Candidatus Blackburnbacteria bacterium RIFCSPLOWO2_01_FULL_44_43]OGY16636.1 MAG: elongation factor Ts [Candidatus Blackburnbacteria bacterium RIFCSPLOWO2_02_
MADIAQIKKLRDETGASVSDIRNALDEAGGDQDKARELLAKRGLERAEKKAEREIKAGRVFSYVHHTGTVGATVVLGCETDFVAKTDEFQKLGTELAMQVSSMNPQDVEEFLEQDYIRDPSTTVGGLIKTVVGKLGENIQVKNIKRFEV